MIQNMISEGVIVPPEVTIKLLEKAIMESENDKFLIDGFPRNEENRAMFESVVSCDQIYIKNVYLLVKKLKSYGNIQTGIVPEFVLFFDCSEEEMERRLLSRNQVRYTT
ncbi:putative UMP/CMP kinase [Helianthus annuus]|nr:putative UMP/CMP kinase [Helianthus annuus]